MKTCEACGREFKWHRRQVLDCPWCGFDNSTSDTPYSEGYLKALAAKRKREEQEMALLWFYGATENEEA
jgi:hypothetical protein